MPRTLQQYLDDHQGDAEKALAAAVADVAARENENGTARSFRRTFEPLLRELEIPTTQEGADQLREVLSGAGDSVELADLVGGLMDVLSELGIDFTQADDVVNADLQSLPQRWKDAQAAIAERDTLRAADEGRALAQVGQANAGVLTDRLKAAGLTAKVTGEAPKTGEQDKRTVRLYDSSGKDVGELKEYATQHWKDYLPSLFPQASSAQGGAQVAGQAGAGTGAVAPQNPIAASLVRSKANQAEGGKVVDALAFT